jgi:hypothetical protein
MSMRAITGAFWMVVSISVLGPCGCAHLSGELSQPDMESIRAVVAKQTSDPIMNVERQAWGVVRVKTGVIRGPLNGGGWTYYMKRSGATWKVKKAVGWTT